MNAQEARLAANKHNTQSYYSNQLELCAMIENAAKQGKYTITLNEFLHKDLEEKLKDDGFVIQMATDRNEPFTLISWE